MKLFRVNIVQIVLLSAGVEAFLSSNQPLQNRGSEDEIDLWLAKAQRVSSAASKACPSSCSGAKNSTSSAEWFMFSDATQIASCNETMLLEMPTEVAPDQHGTGRSVIRACAADFDSEVTQVFHPDEDKASLCTTANRQLKAAAIKLHQPAIDNDEFSVSHLLDATRQITHHLALQKPSCTRNAIEYAYSQSAVIGMFSGAELNQNGVPMGILEEILRYEQKVSLSKTFVFQLCGTDDFGADYTFGAVATNSQNLALAHQYVETWANGGCVLQLDAGMPWMKLNLRLPVPTHSNSTNGTQVPPMSNATSATELATRSRLFARADCKTATVQPGDGCWAVANRCGISQNDLEKYNRANLCTTLVKEEKVCCGSGTLPSTLQNGNADGTCKTRSVVSGDTCGTLASKCGISGADITKVNTKANFCSTLAAGQNICCTSGTLPDYRPKPDSNGNCAVYTTKKGDSCSAIAAARSLELSDLEDYNKKTWGWNGCDQPLYVNFGMCVSSGNPPMPANIPNAVCGPTMNGTVQPGSGTDLSTLNPCPLNVCCNIWGQCGLTDDFCVVSKSATGAPGTSAPGKNGCISNCGRDIIKSSAPAKKIKVAYYESWNAQRPCLNMHVNDINTNNYTHIHFAFANVTKGDFKVEITDAQVKKEFESFKAMTGVQKIISLGGWAFSTEPGTYSVLRDAAKPANRETFKNNLVSFMNENNLDGIDLDWEYPGAPDIPEIPSDDPVNGVNYYRLLSSLKSAVGSSKTVSFAAPASYWYLRSFPIKKMAEDLDYIIYMTYDLHGQWDYGNKWTSPGCDNGNCLRSHINETETKDALSMITKAGAPSNKVVVGVASYGRSFKMAEAGCDSEGCAFTGSPRVSNARPGRCTGVGGYIANAEIDEIVKTGKINKQWTEEGSNMMVYNDTEWVSWMNDETKASRSSFYDSYNFAGTTDWAVDLQTFNEDDAGSDEDDDEEIYIDPAFWSECTGSYNTLQQLEDRKDQIPAHCMEQYMLDVQVAIYDESLKKYKSLVDSGYDGKFEIYEKFAKAQVPDQLNNFMASDKVDKYFTCKESKDMVCCKDCYKGACRGPCTKGSSCKSGTQEVDMDKCPKFEFEVRATTSSSIPNATFHLVDSDGFFADLSDTWGIDKPWLTFSNRLIRINNGCQWSGKDVLSCQDANNNYFHNFPLATEIQIYNPKKVIGDGYSTASDLLSRSQIVAAFSTWDELTQLADSVDATSLPAFTLQQAVESMQTITDKADEIKKQEREQFILDFISGLLFFIPIAGEAAGAASLTAMRSMLRLIGAAGEAGMLVHDLVKNPENAFISIFTYLAGAGVGRKGFKDAANSRRDLTPANIESLGNVKGSLGKINMLRELTC